MIGNGVLPHVVQPLRSNLPIEISQKETEGAGDISEWLIEQFIEDIIPDARADAQTLELVVDKRI